MLRISTIRKANVLEGVSITLNTLEQNIFSYIRNVCESIPFLSRNKYSVTQARVAGGFVRDKLLGRQSKDIDVTVDNMTGEEFASFMQLYDKQKGNQVVQIGGTTEARPEQIKNLAVAFVRIFGEPVEITGLKSSIENKPI